MNDNKMKRLHLSNLLAVFFCINIESETMLLFHRKGIEVQVPFCILFQVLLATWLLLDCWKISYAIRGLRVYFLNIRYSNNSFLDS